MDIVDSAPKEDVQRIAVAHLESCLREKQLKQTVEICFVFLELHCFNHVLLSTSLVAACESVIRKAALSTFPSFEKRRIAHSVLCHMGIRNSEAIMRNLRSVMSPLLSLLLSSIPQ
jgi:hypothetical protein